MARRPNVLKTPKRNLDMLPWHDREILADVKRLGGFLNGHGHACRAYTLEDHYLRHISTTPLEASNLPLSVKQNLVGDLHQGPAYTEEDLERRMSHAFEMQIAYGVSRFDTNIDATPDLPEDGLLAIRIALELKEKYKKHGLIVRVAPTPIFGFKHDPKHKLSRWEVFKQAAKACDYLSLLPEKDDFSGRNTEDRIGFKRHIRKGVELACELEKEVQFHLDQMNVPGERGTERFLEFVEGLDLPFVPGSTEPTVWIIHMISPSAYDEARFARLVDKLLELRIGVIVCPTAALSMRQLRSIEGPLHNSIARVAELIKRKVPIRLGTDNIADVFVPQGDGDMLTEIKMAGLALRMNTPSLWAKLATGTAPNNVDIASIGRMLYEDRKACINANPLWMPGIE